MENKNISLNFFRKQTLKFKLFFLFSITFSIVLFLIDSISIILVLPVIFNFDAINLNNIISLNKIKDKVYIITPIETDENNNWKEEKNKLQSINK